MSIERRKLNAIDKQRHEEPLATKNYDRLWIMNCIYTYLNDESYKWTKRNERDESSWNARPLRNLRAKSICDYNFPI